ncbi:MAG: hypothetical protein IJ026_07740 [Candidatus Methanomethylophilaceae archaeon]|nr:hypothetical protein [Candidatus Methanomethylophilaceae archaeon]
MTGSRREMVERGIDSVNDRVDGFTGRRGSGDWRDRLVPESQDRMILRMFPYFLMGCILCWIMVMFYVEEVTVSSMIVNLCLVFVIAFSLLGLVLFPIMPRGPFPKVYMVLSAIVLSAVLWFFGTMMDFLVYANVVSATLDFFGVTVPETVFKALTFSLTLVVIMLTPVGVLTVTMAYLRVYLVQVFRTMNQHAAEGVRGKAESFFGIPDIIDVEAIHLEPRTTHHGFDLRAAVSLFFYMMVLGVLVSSYLFLNPYFLGAMGWKVMLSTMLMLSMFVPVLIIPWMIVRDLGAKASSSAPRDYDLFNGAKTKLFYTFAGLGVFMMMFLLSMYFGFEIGYILRNYTLYLVPLTVSTVFYSFLYTNNYLHTLKMGIVERFSGE